MFKIPRFSIRSLFYAAFVAALFFSVYRLATNKMAIIGYVFSMLGFLAIFFIPAFLLGLLLNAMVGERSRVKATQPTLPNSSLPEKSDLFEELDD